jgi:electron transport complex protein RnfG
MKDATQATFAQSLTASALQFAAVAFLAVLPLALVQQLTETRRADRLGDSQRAALAAILPPALHDDDLLAGRFSLGPHSSGYTGLEQLGLTEERSAYRARLGGRVSGVILPVETALGYNGSIVLLAGIDTEGRLTGVRVVTHAETRGLGDRLEADLSPWIDGFANRSLANTPAPLWRVKKDGGDFDQFVGATITPRAVVAAIHSALLFFDANQDSLLDAVPDTPELQP